ncbi:acyl-CoA dehydrogenase [Streptomyces sp. A7024]|uniref:Acyl-CoA dehydrogenase n=1 Tax=Streptomyces coryli TaxID=1128680 RepID=A0A6G4TZC5_9ACTN|nr:acyl-CoA dehydrogenase [Streptomyces coryli]NGN65244.1 acyl-CoA dehydrogenase [Streptomyces coryli]
MRFLLDDEQRQFATSLDEMLSAAGTPGVARSWAAGDFGPGRALWARIADSGVFALAIPEAQGGLGPLPVELTVAYEALGRHAVPGPLVETAAAGALLARLGGEPAAAWLHPLAEGKAVATLADGPYALDADAADAVFVVEGETLRLADGAGPVQPTLDPARQLSRPRGGAVPADGPAVTAAYAHAVGLARLSAAAQALGLGRALLTQTVAYAKERRQFGTEIGSFQVIKHRLADTLIALEFAQPLVYGAAVTMADRDLAAAKAAAGEAGYLAARTALQVHGAIGYTEELDLSLWIRKARALRDAWGTPAHCRAAIAAA